MERVAPQVLMTKARSKRELYNLLVTEGGIYLPPAPYCSIDFMLELVTVKKR